MLDNARAVLIVFVVAGHVVMIYHDDSRLFNLLYFAIYLFHMPAFAYFSGKVLRSPQRAFEKSFSALLPLFLGYSVIHLLVRRYFSGEFEWEIFLAPGLLWYLLALLQWRLLLIWFDRLRWPIATSLVIAVAIGFTDRFGTTLALSRTFVFLPFFLMGYYTRQSLIERIRRAPVILVPVALAFLTGAAVFAVTSRLPMSLLVGYTPYADIAGNDWLNAAGRLLVVATTCAALFVLLRVLPRERVFWTRLGTYSLGIYALHMSWVYGLDKWHPNLGTNPVVVAAILLSAVPVAFLLASPPAVALTSRYEQAWRNALTQLTRSPERDEKPRNVNV